MDTYLEHHSRRHSRQQVPHPSRGFAQLGGVTCFMKWLKQERVEIERRPLDWH